MRSSRARFAASIAANAAVDRDDQRDVVGLQTIEDFRLQAVTVLDAIRQKVDDVRAEHLERAPQDHRRRDAVAIVIAVDRDAFFPIDGGENPLHRGRHVRKLEWIVQMIERRPEKSLRALELVDAANRQQPRDRRADLQLAREHSRGVVIAGETFPEERSWHVFYVSTQRREDATARKEALNNTPTIILDKAIQSFTQNSGQVFWRAFIGFA